MKKKVLITGITGQDGSYLAEILLNKGYEVHGMVRRVALENPKHRFWRIFHVLDKITLHDASLETYGSVFDMVNSIKPDECYHLAAQSYVAVSFEDPFSTINTNINGTLYLLSAIRQLSPECKIYFAATSEMFGKAEESPQKESTPFHPRSPYGISKMTGFELMRNYRESYGMFACCGLLFNHECLSENTPIIVRDINTGMVSIKRINDVRKARPKGKNVQQWEVNDVDVWDGKNFVSLNLLTASKRRKENSDFTCKLINTRNGIVNVTNHHNMLNTKGDKIKARRIKIKTKLLHGKFPKVNNMSSVSIDESMFLGMMAGDGHISEVGRSYFCNNDKEIRKIFKGLWLKVALGTTLTGEYMTEYGNTIRLSLNGNPGYLKMLRGELYTFDKYKKIPDRILNAKKDVQLAFLEGYNNTDGLKANLCTYKFKNFKTNSNVLLQGLLFLIGNTTGQRFTLNFEKSEKYYGYYSANLLSPVSNKLKEVKVRKLLKQNKGQREISRLTGISRGFICKIQKGKKLEHIHHLLKNRIEVKKFLYHEDQPEWVYDIETSSGKLMAGVGTIVVSNSPRRGMEFVTRKITNTAARIKLGKTDNLSLGNLEAKRDWGYAPEFVEAMWLMLQQDIPDDYVIATNTSHSIKEFIKVVFDYLDLDWHKYVTIDSKFFRPAEVERLMGDYTKAYKDFGWKPKIYFKDLAKIMADADLVLEKK